MSVYSITDKPDDRPYRRCVGVALFNREGLVFVGKRASGGEEMESDGHSWQMPQGGIDEGESPYEAALRELYEETNVKSVSLLAEAPDWLSYDLPQDISGRAWKGRFRGQTQRWFAFRLEAGDDEIDVHAPGGGHHRPEFEGWRWASLASTPDLIIPFKRSVYEDVVRAFARFAA
ncbi:MAG TPA: RNA pyrophosphohydrolase [Afifellaceae bacterium]|jgi:putative (di)nucleoside polyphosphate hydrolase|nr:RNA pyrophosphohydrolase [Afifellaceae bacterium]